MRYYLKVWDSGSAYGIVLWVSSSYLSLKGTLDINEVHAALNAAQIDHPSSRYQIVTDPNQPTEPPHVLH